MNSYISKLIVATMVMACVPAFGAGLGSSYLVTGPRQVSRIFEATRPAMELSLMLLLGAASHVEQEDQFSQPVVSQQNSQEEEKIQARITPITRLRAIKLASYNRMTPVRRAIG